MTVRHITIAAGPIAVDVIGLHDDTSPLTLRQRCTLCAWTRERVYSDFAGDMLVELDAESDALAGNEHLRDAHGITQEGARC